jgi:hypothetical protein
MLSLLQAEHYYSLQVTTPKEELLSWQERPQQIVARWGKYKAGHTVRRCRYITADFATARSQSGISFSELCLHKEPNINQEMAKNIRFLNINYCFHLWSYSSRDTFVELCKHRFVMQPLQNPTLGIEADNGETG